MTMRLRLLAIGLVVVLVLGGGTVAYAYTTPSLTSLYTQVAYLGFQVQNLLRNDAMQNAQIAALQAQVAANTANIAQNASDIATLQGKVMTLEGKVSTLEGKVMTLEGKVSTLEGQVMTLQSQVTTLQVQVSALQGQVTALQGQVGALQGQVTSLQGQVTALQGQVNGIQAALNAHVGDTTTAHNYDARYVRDSGPDLRMVQGILAADGSVITGGGFTATRTAQGSYTITLGSAFSSYPSIAVLTDNSAYTATWFTIGFGLFTVRTYDAAGSLIDVQFTFTAVGPQ